MQSTLCPEALPTVVKRHEPPFEVTAETTRPVHKAQGTAPDPEMAATDELRWLRDHGEEVAKHAGHWVAIKGQGIVAHGPTLAAVVDQARRLQIERPLIIRVPSKELPGLILTWI